MKQKNHIKTLVITLIILLITISITVIYNLYFGIDLKNSVNVQRNDFQNKSSLKIVNFIALVLITPFFEELLYRYGLKFSANKCSFLVIGILLTIYYLIVPKTLNYNAPLVILLFFGSIIVIYFFTRYIIKKNSTKIKLFYLQNTKLIITLSIVAFGYSHFSMYNNFSLIYSILLSPLILLPYFIAGFSFSYIRIKKGFIWGVFAHVLWNLIVFSLN
jgi:hypothetical protein